MSRQNVSLVLAERPAEEIVPGKTFSRQVEPAPTASDLKDGEVLVEALYLSLDPAMRGWVNGNLTIRRARLCHGTASDRIKKIGVRICRRSRSGTS